MPPYLQDDDIDEFLSRYTRKKVEDEARRQGLDPSFAGRIAQTESSYRPDVITGRKRSTAGAIGPMQLMPGTAKDLGVDPYHVDRNIEGGVRYLKEQMDRFGDPAKAAAAYNAGPGAVQKYGGVPPYAETQDYVRKVASAPATDDIDEFLSRYEPSKLGKPATKQPSGPTPVQVRTLGETRRDVEAKSSDRARKAADIIQAVEGGKRRAIDLFRQADKAGKEEGIAKRSERGLDTPIDTATGRPYRPSEILRAKAEAELETANRLAQDAQKQFGDLIEVGFGEDTDPAQSNLRPEQRRKWAYAKARTPEVGDLAFIRARRPEEMAAFQTPEQIAERSRLTRRVQEERKRYEGRSLPARLAERAATDIFEESPGLSPAAREDLQIRRAAMGLDPDETPSGLSEVAGQFGRRLLSGVAAIPRGAAEIADQLSGFSPMASPIRPRLAEAVKPYTDQMGAAAQMLTPVDPANESWLTAKIPQAFGSAASFALGGGARGTSAALGAAMNAGQIAQEMDAAGVDPARRDAAIALAGATGLTEAFGVGRILDRFGLKQPFIVRAVDILEEGGQELFQEWMNDVNSVLVGAYNPDGSINPLQAKNIEAGLLGLIVGGGFHGASAITEGLNERRAIEAIRQETPPPLSLTPPSTPKPTVITPLRATAPGASGAGVATGTAELPAPDQPLSGRDRLLAALQSLQTPDSAPEITAESASAADSGPAVRVYAPGETPEAPPAGRALASFKVDGKTYFVEHPRNITRGAAVEMARQQIPEPTEPLEAQAPAAPEPDARSAFRLHANDAKIRAAHLEEAGDYASAAREYESAFSALRRLRSSLGRAKTPEGAAEITGVDREITAAQQAMANARQLARRQGTEIRRAAKRPAPPSAPLLGSVVNQEGGVPEIPEEPVDFGRLAAQEETRQQPQRGPKPSTDLSAVEYLKRKTGGQGIRVSDRSEAAVLGAKEAGIVGLTNQRSKWSVNDAAVMLDEGGFTLPDGRRFTDPSVTENDVLTYLGDFGKDRRMGTRGLRSQIEEQERAYYENLPETEERAPSAPLSGPLPDAGAAFAGRPDAYDQAIQFVRSVGQAEPAKIARHLNIGYAQAMAFIQRMQSEGILKGRDLAEGQPRGEMPPLVRPLPARPTPEQEAEPVPDFVPPEPDDMADRPFGTTKAGAPGVSFSPFNVMVVNNRADIERLYDLPLNSPEARKIVAGLREYIAREKIEPRHLGNLLNYVRNYQMEQAFYEMRGLSRDEVFSDVDLLERQTDDAIRGYARTAPLDERDILERSIKAIDAAKELVQGDPDLLDILESVATEDGRYTAEEFLNASGEAYGIDADAATAVLESRRSAERERRRVRAETQSARIEAGSPVVGAERGTAGLARHPEAVRFGRAENNLVNTDPATIPDADYDAFLDKLENFRNLNIRGLLIDWPESAVQRLHQTLRATEAERRGRVKGKRLPARYEAPEPPIKFSKEEFGRMMIESIRAREAEQAAETAPKSRTAELESAFDEAFEQFGEPEASPKGRTAELESAFDEAFEQFQPPAPTPAKPVWELGGRRGRKEEKPKPKDVEKPRDVRVQVSTPRQKAEGAEEFTAYASDTRDLISVEATGATPEEAEARAREEFARQRREQQAARKPSEPAKKAVKEAKKGLDEVAKGLKNILSGIKKDEGGAVKADLTAFDDAVYKQVRPHLEAAFEHFKAAAQDVREAMTLLLRELNRKFGFSPEDIQRLRPYIVQFMKEQTAAPVIGETIDHRDEHLKGAEVVAESEDGSQVAVKTKTGDLTLIKHPKDNQAVRRPETEEDAGLSGTTGESAARAPGAREGGVLVAGESESRGGQGAIRQPARPGDLPGSAGGETGRTASEGIEPAIGAGRGTAKTGRGVRQSSLFGQTGRLAAEQPATQTAGALARPETAEGAARPARPEPASTQPPVRTDQPGRVGRRTDQRSSKIGRTSLFEEGVNEPTTAPETQARPVRAGESRQPAGEQSAPAGERSGKPRGKRGGRGTGEIRPDDRAGSRPVGGEGADTERVGGVADAGTAEAPDYVDQVDPSRTETQPPSAARRPDNHEITDIDAVVPTGKKSKLEANLAAIRLLRDLQAESRTPTREEQDVLGRFVGWGQFPDLFNDANEAGQKLAAEREELKSLLGEQEYERAKRSTLNAHYTSPRVVQKMWEVARRLGFKGGRVLEPSMGVGYFYGLMPRDLMAQSRLAGVEIDPITGAIARMLYPGASINIKGFQEVKIADGFYDLVIGNVPFGDFRVHDPDYNRYRANIHDYFILKSLDKTREGGVVAVITSTGTMDKADERIRKEIAKRADLVAAMRFPDSTFEKNAGTQVVTDLLIFRKRKPDEKGDFRWVYLNEMPDPDGGPAIPINEYYYSNPDMILGRLDRKSKLYGGGQPHVSATGDFAERFEKAIQSLPENIFGERATTAHEPNAVADAVQDNTIEGGYILKEGVVLQRQGDVYVVPDFTPEEAAKAAKLIPVRDALNALNAAQLKGDSTAEPRRLLNRAYDAFVSRYGPIRKATNAKLLAEDPSSYLLIALEASYDPKKQKAKKADIFTKDTITRTRQAGDVSTPASAVAVSLFESGGVDIDRVASLLKASPEEAARKLTDDGLAFETPAGTWATAEAYLSGNVRKKLVEARAAAEIDEKFQRNVAALEEVQPEDVPMDMVSVKLGAGWVPTEDIKAFAAHLMQTDPGSFSIRYIPASSAWVATGGGPALSSSLATEVYGTSRVNFVDLLDAALNDRPVKVYDRTREGSEFNLEESEKANAKVQEIRDQFADWIWADDERATRLHRYYNDNFNNMRVIEYTGAHYADERGEFRLPGMNPAIALRPNQIKDVWQAVANGKLMDASEVGAGKTFILGAIAMEWRRLGMSRKPAIAVPKPRIAATVAELQTLYPAAKILSLEKSFDKENRQRTTAMMATGDYDMIVLSHEQLDKMPMSAGVIQEYIGEELREIEERIKEAEEEAEEAGDKRAGNRIVKRLEKIKERVEAKLQEALDGANKDKVVTFEETGIDALLIDEAHAFKSLPVHSRRSDVKGVPSTRSDRATSMLMRTRWLMRQNNNKGVVFATGTPVTNTLAEVYNLQRYLQPELLEERGIENFDAWADQFANVSTQFEYTASGDYQAVSRMAEFVNLPELQQMIRQIMATNFVDDMTWIARPRKTEHVVTSPMTEDQVEYLQEIRRRVEALRHMTPQQRRDSGENFLLISTDARKSALSPRMVKSDTKDSGGKIEKVAENALRIHKERPEVAQMIFLDFGVNPNSWGYSVYDDIQNRLIEGGIPKEKIANFGRMSDTARQKAAEKLNSGEYLIGLGSSGKMGTGINAQKRIAAMHHVDAPWLPAFLEQRNGRGHRQGNMNDPTKPADQQEVEAYYYTTEGSFDVVMWQALTRKSDFIRQFMRGDMSVREMRMDDTGDESTGEMGPEMILAATSGNPYELDRIKLIKDIEKLERQERSHRQQQSRYRTRIAESGRQRAELERRLAGYQANVAQFESTKGQEFKATINGKSLDDREAAGNQLAIAYVEARVREVTKVGEYRGFGVFADKTDANPRVFLQKDDGGEVGFNLKLAEPAGAFASADASLRYQSSRVADVQGALARLERDTETAKEEVDKPFKRAEELEQKRAQLREIQRKMEEMYDQEPGKDIRKLALRLEDLQFAFGTIDGEAYDLAQVRDALADVVPDKAAFDRWMLAMHNEGIVKLFTESHVGRVPDGNLDLYVRNPGGEKPYTYVMLQKGWEKKAPDFPPITSFIEAGTGTERERTSFQPKPLAASESRADIATNIRFRASKSRAREGLIYGNEQAHFLLDRADELIHGSRNPFNGLNLSPDEAREMAAQLRREKYWWRDEAPEVRKAADAQVEALAKAFEDAAAKNERVIYTRGDRSFREIRGTVYHELSHNAERKYRGRIGNWFKAAPHSAKIGRALAEKGYTEDEFTGEAVAHILGGQRAQLGLSLDEAVQFMDSYFTNVTYGARDFAETQAAPEMRETIRRANARQGTAGSARPIQGEVSERAGGRGFRRGERSLEPGQAEGTSREAGRINGVAVSADELAVFRALQRAAPRFNTGGVSAFVDARKFTDLNKESFDQVVLSLARKDVIAVHYHDWPQSLSPEKLAELVKDESMVGKNPSKSAFASQGPTYFIAAALRSFPPRVETGPERERAKPGTYLGAGLGGLQAFFDREARPQTTPLREIANMLGHRPLGVDPAETAKATQDKLIEALQRGKTGTLPGARAMYWAEKLKMKGAADKLANKQAKFIEDAVSLTATIAENSAKMKAAERGSKEYEAAKRDLDRARVKLSNHLSKAEEYTHPFEYAAKGYKASLLSAPHIPYFNIIDQVALFPFHEAQKAIDFLVPAKVFRKWGIPYEKEPVDLRTWVPAIGRELKAIAKGGKSAFGDIKDMLTYGVTRQGLDIERVREQGGEEAKAGGTDKYELGHRPKLMPGVDQTIMMVGRTQGAADVPFFNVVFATAIAAEADATARKIAKEHPELNLTKAEIAELARDLAHEPSAAMVLHAADEANRFKLDYPTWAYDKLRKLRGTDKPDGSHLHSAWKAALDFAIPFSKIPLAAVDMALFRYSPAGLVRVALRGAKARRELKEEGKTQTRAYARETAEIYRQSVVGSSALLTLGALGTFGYLSATGGGEDDERQNVRAAREALGEKYKPEIIAGDTAFEVGRLGPIGRTASIGARIAAAGQRRYDTKTEDFEPESKRIDRMMTAAAQGIALDNPLARAAEDVKEAMDTRSLAAGVGKYVGGKARALVPGIAREAAKLQSPTKVIPENNEFLGRLRGDLQSGMPFDIGFGSRAQMAPRLSALGKPVEEPNPFSFTREVRRMPQIEELRDTGVGLSKPRREAGESAEGYNARVRAKGAQLGEALGKIEGDEALRAASPFAKRAIYDRFLDTQQMNRAERLSDESEAVERQIEALKADTFEALRQTPEYRRMNEGQRKAVRDVVNDELKRYRGRVGSGRVREKAARTPDWTPGELAQAAMGARP